PGQAQGFLHVLPVFCGPLLRHALGQQKNPESVIFGTQRIQAPCVRSARSSTFSHPDYTVGSVFTLDRVAFATRGLSGTGVRSASPPVGNCSGLFIGNGRNSPCPEGGL